MCMAHKTLFDSYQLGPIALNNRIVMAPLTRSRAGAGDAPRELNAEYYAQRASAGLIVSEAKKVSKQGQGYLWTPGIYTPEQVEGWKRVVEAVHGRGGKIFMQMLGKLTQNCLTHCASMFLATRPGNLYLICIELQPDSKSGSTDGAPGLLLTRNSARL